MKIVFVFLILGLWGLLEKFVVKFDCGWIICMVEVKFFRFNFDILKKKCVKIYFFKCIINIYRLIIRYVLFIMLVF